MAPASASKGKGTVYAPVNTKHLDEEDVFDEEWIDPLETKKAEERKRLVKTVFWVEASNLLLLCLLYAVWIIATKDEKAYTDMPLAYNTTETFATSPMTNFEAAALLNLNVSNTNGLVSLPIHYASKHHLQPSELDASPGQAIFQVDVFHQLQCLDLLRNTIADPKRLHHLDPSGSSEIEKTHAKSFHCLKYLAEAVACHSDMTLLSLTRDLTIKEAPARQCRDFEAVQEWTEARRYE